MTQSRKSGLDKQKKRETEKVNMSKRGGKNAEKKLHWTEGTEGAGRQTGGKKTKTSSSEIKSKLRQIRGETDEWGNELIYHVKLKE